MNTNSNPTNGNQEAGKVDFPKVTTQVLGISTERSRDLTGLVLNPAEISTAVEKFLCFYGIENSDIYSIKVGADANSNLRIIAEVKEKAFKETHKKSTNWMAFTEGEEDTELLPKKYYDAWRNKIYWGKKKNLPIKVQRRSFGDKKKDRDNKVLQIMFDAEIFIAFAYDINYMDPFYKISAVSKRWLPAKKIDDMSGKERKRYNALKGEYNNLGMSELRFAVITFRESEKGFHPAQVDEAHER